MFSLTNSHFLLFLPIIVLERDISLKGWGKEVSSTWVSWLAFPPHVYLFSLFSPTGSENRLGASLHLQPLLLDYRFSDSTNQLPLLYLDACGSGKYQSSMCCFLALSVINQRKNWFLTTLYDLYGITTALASYLAVPITQASSWKEPYHPPHLLCLAAFFGLAPKSPL